jgi:pyruvate,orthophosphate dikinase
MTGSTCPPRTTTSPDDIEGMAAAVGILTATGGFTSHAAVVARSMNKTCVVGCPGLTVKGDIVQLIAQAPKLSHTINGPIELSIDGDTGRVWIGKVPVTSGEDSDAMATVLSWCLEASGESLVGDDFDPSRASVPVPANQATAGRLA